jgi:hypothetical protein
MRSYIKDNVMKKSILMNIHSRVLYLVVICLSLMLTQTVFAQRNYRGRPMFIDVNAIKLDMKKVNGEGQFTSQYSWRLTDGDVQSEIFMYPQDEWHSRMLYQIFNPICPDDNGFINEKGEHKIIPETFVSNGKNDYSWKNGAIDRPMVTVDDWRKIRNIPGNDPNLKSDIKQSGKILSHLGHPYSH